MYCKCRLRFRLCELWTQLSLPQIVFTQMCLLKCGDCTTPAATSNVIFVGWIRRIRLQSKLEDHEAFPNGFYAVTFLGESQCRWHSGIVWNKKMQLLWKYLSKLIKVLTFQSAAAFNWYKQKFPMKIVNFEFKSTHSEVTIRVPNSAAATIYPHSGLKKNLGRKKSEKKRRKRKKRW